MKRTTCTLLFAIDGDQILLGLKKRGFGAGKWNGFGGKLEPGESVEAAMIRETQEEVGITPLDFQKMANHTFTYQAHDEIVYVHTYITSRWQGEPCETDEMLPQWFAQADIPYAQMWEDDQLWLPAVLDGHHLQTAFRFDALGKLIYKSVIEVTP